MGCTEHNMRKTGDPEGHFCNFFRSIYSASSHRQLLWTRCGQISYYVLLKTWNNFLPARQDGNIQTPVRQLIGSP